MRAETPANDKPPAGAGFSRDFRQIFDAHARFVWRSLLGLGVHDSDVADASQQVFLVLRAKLGHIDAGCAISTFVYGICLRVASDFRRRAHTRREQLCAQPPERLAAAPQDGIVSHREALRHLQTALDQLDPDQREVFVLYEIEELPMTEVATAVGCPLQTAYSRLHAARGKVARAMGEHLEGL